MENKNMNIVLKIIFITGFFLSQSILASLRIETQFNGNIETQIVTEKHFRHSGDCYIEKKPIEQKLLTPQILPLSGGLKNITHSSQETWKADLSSPFARNIRKLLLSNEIVNSEKKSSIIMSLSDEYSSQTAIYTKNQCTHMDGTTKPNSASLEGDIKMIYKVPSNVWLVKVTRTEFDGIFTNKSIEGYTGSLNDQDKKANNSISYQWVTPNSELTLRLKFPLQIPGTKNIFNFSYSFEPILGSNIDLLSLNKKISDTNISKLLLNDEDTLNLIRNLLSVFNKNNDLEVATKQMELSKVSALSDQLFQLANEVVKNPRLGSTVKTASALAAYEISVSILKELASFCKEVEIYLPFTNRTIKTTGVRAASFWLNRGISVVKNYSFAPFEALLGELSMMQSNGFTYAAVFKDINLKKRYKSAFEFIDRNVDMSHSPIISVQLAIEKTLKNIGHVGASDQYTIDLQKRLLELRLIEDDFFIKYGKLETEFRENNNAIINVTPLNETLAKLKLGKQEINQSMSENIRLISLNYSDDKDALFTKMSSLLSNQVAIMEKPILSVPFFETVKAEYKKYRDTDPIIKTTQACVRGEF